MQSLYDSLNLPNPKAPNEPVRPWPESMTGQEFAALVVASVEFRQYILLGLSAGSLPQGVVKQLMDYAWGKPVERVAVVDDFETMSREQLLARLDVLKQRVQDSAHEDVAVTHSNVH